MNIFFKKQVEEKFSLFCKEEGFKKKNNRFYKPLNCNTDAIIMFGLSSLREEKGLSVLPIMSILYKDVEDLYSKLTGYNRLKTMHGTTGLSLGYLMLENVYKEWHFLEDSDNEIMFQDIFQNIEIYGFNYFKEMENREFFFQQLENREKHVLGGVDIYLPILYYLRGEKEKGLQVIEETVRRKTHRPTDEEIRKGDKSENLKILRAGEQNITSESLQQMLNELPSGGEIIMVGAGNNGLVDPLYLKFAEAYRALL